MKHSDFITSAYGVQIPKIIYGTAWKKDRTAALVEQAIKAGFRGIDTACQPRHYHEPGVGEGLAACLGQGLSRSDIYLQTKFTPLNGQDPQQVPYDPKVGLSEQVAQSFDTSLRNLKTTYLDCLILHSPIADEHQQLEVWRAMEAIFKAGGAKQLGISNCYNAERLALIYQKADIKPAVLQNRFYADTRYDRKIRDFCREHQVLYQGFWTLTANPGVLQHKLVQKLAIQYQRSPAQVFFRFLTQIGIIPLTGTTSATHMRDDLAIFEFALTPDECAAIDDLL